ncbi:glycosyltransferase family 9 protein, partial [Falsiroseomonas oryzae]|uniref:glycosyltransferase family 9 protein n=1 Tax=Falsiroseomonas oryzae TaxID=2766473 RepID=UPI0022EB00F5
MRILFVTSTRIGDAVLSTALLAHLLRQHPEARVTVACGPAATGVFERMPGLERLIVVAKKPFSLHWPKLWAQVAFTRWDLVVDLRASALAWMVPARRRAVGRGGRRPGHRLTHIAQVLDLSPPPLPVAWTAPTDEARAATLLPDGPWLVLGPTANWSGKVWPAERFVAVAAALTAPGAPLDGARIAVLGGPGG